MSEKTNHISQAISRSRSHDEIVKVAEFSGDSGDALEAIRDCFDGYIDYTMIDHEGSDRLDVWGWTDATPENEQDWRLLICFEDESEEL